jgi:prepilin-type N-terminal cleavage/methylation domain-containing protein
MKKKGFTLIELLAVIVILAIIALIAMPLILNVIDEAKKGAFKNTAYGIVEAGQLVYAKDMLQGIEGEVTFTYVDGVETASVDGKKLDYKGTKPKNGTITLNSEGKIAIAIHDGKYCAQKGYEENVVTLTEKIQSECALNGEVSYSDYNYSKGVNKPKLTAGMTPIKWNGTDWVSTNENDIDWYNYDENKWANVKTADGSFWVWIPRYIYKITSCWHENCDGSAGNIDVQFSIGIDDTKNGTIELDTSSGAEASNNKWTNHSAFTFGSKQISGIWVAKFEPTAVEGVESNDLICDELDNVTNKTVKIVPNETAWRCIDIGKAFEVSRSMETNPIYGWNSDGIDTHMMKNTEWGAVAYLSKSVYGKYDEEIWINPDNNFTTGCAGSSVSTDVFECNAYETVNGQKASTTGNIYGVYGFSGGAWDFVAAYVDNAHPNLALYGESIVSADNKYKDVYLLGDIDGRPENYNEALNKKGDAVYETSSLGIDYNSWNEDRSNMPVLTTPFFNRGGAYSQTTSTGAFNFLSTRGHASRADSFRPVLIVGQGL